jgi:hypothetical protein
MAAHQGAPVNSMVFPAKISDIPPKTFIFCFFGVEITLAARA